MIIGVPKEIKDHESRVSVTPGGCKALVKAGHKVLVETKAGELSYFPDEEYRAAGATIVEKAADVWAGSELIVKVKEPMSSEVQYFRSGLTLFTYLHLAPIPDLTEGLLKNKVTGIAYETIRDKHGYLPLLTPMSEIAGRMSVQVGSTYLEAEHGGRGVLLGGVPGVIPGNIAIIGGGMVGTNAAKIAIGLGARVTLADKDLNRLRDLDHIFGGRFQTLASNEHNVAEAVAEADLVIGAVLVPGTTTPKVVTREMVKNMKKGAVIVDVAIDQGGCVETARPTTHTNPSFVEYGVVHYCVTNMPAAVPHTSTLALTNATFPYVMNLAKGVKDALRADAGLAEGVNTCEGHITYKGVATSQNKPYTPVADLIK